MGVQIKRDMNKQQHEEAVRQAVSRALDRQSLQQQSKLFKLLSKLEGMDSSLDKLISELHKRREQNT